MNWSLVFKYFALLPLILGAVEQMSSAIAAGQSASTPPLNTYLESKHGSITLTWTPIS